MVEDMEENPLCRGRDGRGAGGSGGEGGGGGQKAAWFHFQRHQRFCDSINCFSGGLRMNFLAGPGEEVM